MTAEARQEAMTQADALADTLSAMLRAQSECNQIILRLSKALADQAAHMLAVETLFGLLLRESGADAAVLRRAARRELEGNTNLAAGARQALDGILARLARGPGV